MKKLTLIALILVVALMPLSVFGCGNASKVTYNVTVTVNDPEDASSPYVDKLALTIEVKEGYAPTVLDAVQKACQDMEYEFTASDDGLSVKSIAEIAEFDEIGEDGKTVTASSYWSFLLNGEEPKTGRAGNTEIKDGDVIVFNFVTDRY